MAPPGLMQLLPQVYEKLFPDSFRCRQPPEVFATCAECAMVDNTALPRPGETPRRFHPNLKCCTYYPELPNYLVGSLLKEEESGAGRERILQLIQSRSGISPLGVYPPKLYSMLFAAKEDGAFGNSRSLLCPLYVVESGSCSIWNHRNAICSTYYCKHASGHAGVAFWGDLKTYLRLVERALTKYALLVCTPDNVLDLIPKQNSQASPTRLSSDDLDRVPLDDAGYGKLWGGWTGREIEFYIQCYEAVASLDTHEFQRLIGVDGQLSAMKVMRSHKRVMSVPNLLVRAPSLQLVDEGGVYNIAIPNVGVTLQIPVPLLDSFDGTARNDEIITNASPTVAPDDAEELIWIMYCHGILIAARSTEYKSSGSVPMAEGLAYEIHTVEAP